MRGDKKAMGTDHWKRQCKPPQTTKKQNKTQLFHPATSTSGNIQGEGRVLNLPPFRAIHFHIPFPFPSLTIYHSPIHLILINKESILACVGVGVKECESRAGACFLTRTLASIALHPNGCVRHFSRPCGLLVASQLTNGKRASMGKRWGEGTQTSKGADHFNRQSPHTQTKTKKKHNKTQLFFRNIAAGQSRNISSNPYFHLLLSFFISEALP